MKRSKLTRVGDTIETTVRHPTPGTTRVRLLEPEACAHANELLMDPKSNSRLVQPAA